MDVDKNKLAIERIVGIRKDFEVRMEYGIAQMPNEAAIPHMLNTKFQRLNVRVSNVNKWLKLTNVAAAN